MTWRFMILLLLGVPCFTMAQINPPEPVPPTTATEQQLENITENNEDLETEDDSYLQQLNDWQRHPLNINMMDEGLLKEFRMLSPMQIQNFLSYRSLLGNLINIYELQAVPGWDLATIQKIRPYIIASQRANLLEDIGERLQGGDHTILLRVTQTLEKSRGYLLDSSNAKNFYPGSPQRVFVRYKYNYKNLLQYGVVGEKDAGEEFFKGSQKQGFDFYSAHFFVRNIGVIKSLAIGDFAVNLGQGLTQWMSLSFKKGPEIAGIKRQAAVLRPYNSSGEIYFHRGAGITVGRRNWQATIFGSLRKVDANFNAADTLSSQEEYISSLQTSGFHRTNSELEDKGSQRQLAFGGNFSLQLKRLHIGLNGIQYQFKYPLQKTQDPYNYFALAGKQFGNYSTDYSFTYRNLHFFGEAATTNKNYLAFVNGLLLSVAANVDMSFLYRNISKGYQSLYTSAFTESTYPTNEKGFFAGISIRPATSWRIDAYGDVYHFPFLRYRVNSPSDGKDFMLQVNYKPNKQFEIYGRYKQETKALNTNPDGLPLSQVTMQPKKDLRVHFAYKITPAITIRSRAQMIWFDQKGAAPSEGFLLYTDVLYKPILSRISGNIRLQYFETDDYNSRLYAYENDVLYSYSIPVFYGKGYRTYLNVNYDITRNLTAWARIARTIYPGQDMIGSGLDQLNSNHRTEVKLQLLYSF